MAALSDTSADPARLRLRSVLATQELCVCDLATALKISESAVFHQLHLLRSQRFVKYRQGHKVHYSLVDSHVINLSREAADHLDEADSCNYETGFAAACLIDCSLITSYCIQQSSTVRFDFIERAMIATAAFTPFNGCIPLRALFYRSLPEGRAKQLRRSRIAQLQLQPQLLTTIHLR